MVFDDASTYTCILGLSRKNDFIQYKQLKPSELFYDSKFIQIELDKLDQNKWNLHDGDESKLFNKLK